MVIQQPHRIMLGALLRRIIKARGPASLKGIVFKDLLKDGEWCSIVDAVSNSTDKTIHVLGNAFNYTIHLNKLVGSSHDTRFIQSLSLVSLCQVPPEQRKYVEESFRGSGYLPLITIYRGGSDGV